jgi:hypothetical protein
MRKKIIFFFFQVFLLPNKKFKFPKTIFSLYKIKNFFFFIIIIFLIKHSLRVKNIFENLKNFFKELNKKIKF